MAWPQSTLYHARISDVKQGPTALSSAAAQNSRLPRLRSRCRGDIVPYLRRRHGVNVHVVVTVHCERESGVDHREGSRRWVVSTSALICTQS
jgi:hypothetical protein